MIKNKIKFTMLILLYEESYGTIDLGATIALIFFQILGVVAGAVKG